MVKVTLLGRAVTDMKSATAIASIAKELGLEEVIIPEKVWDELFLGGIYIECPPKIDGIAFYWSGE